MQRPINILLVDDDHTFVFLTRKIIASTGFASSVTEVYDGQEAINYLKLQIANDAQLPDLILLDLSMPVMDGWAFLKEYSAIYPKIQQKITLYIVSSSISPHDVEKSKSFAEVKDFIIKPLRKDKLAEILQNI